MADIKISGLPEATALTGSELFLASQTAADVKATLQRLRDELDWMRPSDWPAMPATAANTVHALVAIHDHGSNNHAVRISVSSGTYSVDWGDGSTSSGVASNTTAEHSYTYGDVALGSVTSRGYKVAVVTITTSGGNITIVNTSVPPTGSSQPLQWLELQINAPAATTFSNLGTNTAGLSRLIEHINFVAHGTVTALSFDGMAGLVKITEPGTLFTNITSLQSVFRGCSSLRRINLSGLGTGITTMQTAFQNCSSLTEFIFPSGTLGSSLTNLTQAFNGCGRITSFTFPSGAFSGVTTAANAFNGCASLGRIVFPSGAFSSTTAMGSFLANCTGLRYVEFGSALSAVTDIGGMLNNCNTLQHVKFASGGFGSLSSATTNFVNGCWALARIENCSIPLTFTLLNCRLGAAALDEIYTALPTISSQTITVTGNHGTWGDTPSIATGKGWTVTG